MAKHWQKLLVLFGLLGACADVPPTEQSSVSPKTSAPPVAGAAAPTASKVADPARAAVGGSPAAVSVVASGGAPAIRGEAIASAGAGGAPAAVSGAASAAGSGGGKSAPSTQATRPPCLKKDSQLVVIGDSYLNWLTHDFPNDFTSALGHGDRFCAEPGASMASGGIATPVPDQLAMTIADDPDMIAVVMTGGGNDVLLSDVEMFPGSDDCKNRPDSPTLQVCKDVVNLAMDAAKKLMQTAQMTGVRDVVYIYYPHIPGNLLGIYATSPNEILDYSLPMARETCEQAEQTTAGMLRCHFLDLQPIFQGHADWFADDGIHENATGSAVIAREVVKIMQDKCIAQPAASGCCEP